MEQYKELHLATDIEKLNRIALSNSQKAVYYRKPSALMNVAKKLYSESQNAPFDEEMTYILLYRFVKLYDRLIQVHNDTNFVNSMLGKEARKAKAQITDVKNNLINRYEETNVKKAAAIELVPISSPVEDILKTVFNNALFIECSDLFRAFSDRNINLLIMDARSEKDFAESHMKDVQCINIPESCIKSGLSAYTLGLSLPTTSIEQWNKRDSFDVIVLVDWNIHKSGFAASKLDKLRTILMEWDFGRNYKEEPVVLEEGYIEWLERYPMLCTSVDVKYFKVNTELDDLLNLDSIEYPTDSESKSHEVFKQKLEREIVSVPEETQSRDSILKEEELVIKQNKEVAKESLKRETELTTICERISKEYDLAILEQLKKKKKDTEYTISKLAQKEANLLEKRSDLTNRFNLAVSFKPDEIPSQDRAAKLQDINKSQEEYLDILKAREKVAQDRQSLLDAARQAKETKMSSGRPTVNRTTKPKTFVLTDMAKHMDGEIKLVDCGLTGLINIKNTCYMNTIIQCLRHLPVITTFYCKAEYPNHVHRSPPFISNEVAHLIRALWSNSHSVIKPYEFYKKFTSLSPIYKAGYHEDCMEFFLQLFNYLSDDCASDIVAKNFWSETQRAWCKQHSGKKSFYINTFYHQIRTQYSCPTCKVSNLKFDIENIFYLSVPEFPFNLEDSMESYLNSTERVMCKKCKQLKDVYKEISFYPNVLIIVLKRHTQSCLNNKGARYKKNENQCYFPVHNFKVRKYIYVLHAIALHSGTTQSGHYTAACLNPINNRWYLFNDEKVSELNISDPSLRTKAYVFFYQKTPV